MKYSLKYAQSLPKFERGISALCWAYNEQESIEEYLRKINGLLQESCADYEIVVVDDCSTDKTPEKIKSLQKEIPQIKYFRNERNLNVGLSHQRAVKEATKEFLFWQTIDWAYDISLFRVYLEFLKDNDIIAGVRRAPVLEADRFIKPFLGVLRLLNMKHLTRRSDTPSKAFVSVVNYLLIRFLFRVPLSDYQNVCIYPTKFIQSIKYEGKSSFVNPEGLIRAYWGGKRIREVPISFLARKVGEAKGTKFKAIRASITDIFKFYFRWVILGKRGNIQKGRITRLNPSEWEDVSPQYFVHQTKKSLI